MGTDRDRRTYDLLRLIEANEPIGSIRLVDEMQRLGYSIKGRTIRLLLSELDESGLTAKVPGRGRRLTCEGRSELNRGDVSGRYKQIRNRIATLTGRVTYDPTGNDGEAVVCTAEVPAADLPAAVRELAALSASSLGPVPVAADRVDGTVALRFPSSLTLDGVLLARGIDAALQTAGLVEYLPDDDEVVRYVDVISGEGSTLDVVGLLVEAGRTNVAPVLAGETGRLIVDNREFPLDRFEETEELAAATAEQLGGVLDVRRPREPGPFPFGSPGWSFASLTYGGIGEIALGLLFERSLTSEWKSLDGLLPAAEFESPSNLRSRFDAEDSGG